jgi:hypothetical protein
MKIARPKPESFNQIIDFLNWLAEGLDHLEDDPEVVDEFLDDLRNKLKYVDYKARHVVKVCEALVEQLCDLEDKTLSTRPDIIAYLQAEEEREKAEGKK